MIQKTGMIPKLTGKTALVTGGNRGIGKAIVLKVTRSAKTKKK